jgi:hypothetical protein
LFLVSFFSSRSDLSKNNKTNLKTPPLPPFENSKPAAQQLGRTHRTNQQSAPMYAFATTPLGGETRFLSSTAKRIASLGAASRGDRRAAFGDSMDEALVDSHLGKRALRGVGAASHARARSLAEGVQLLDVVGRVSEVFEGGALPASLAEADPTISALFSAADAAARAADAEAAAAADEAEVIDDDEGEGDASSAARAAADDAAAAAAADQAARAAVLHLHVACSAALNDVGLPGDAFAREASSRKAVSPKVFLNRLMSIPVGTQVALFAYFSAALARVIVEEKRAGRFDPGVAEIHCSPELGGIGPDGLPPRPELWCEDPATGR